MYLFIEPFVRQDNLSSWPKAVFNLYSTKKNRLLASDQYFCIFPRSRGCRTHNGVSYWEGKGERERLHDART